MQSDLAFGNNTILSRIFFFFLIIDLYLLIPETIAHVFNLIVEVIIPLEISTKDVKAETEIDTVTAKTKVRKCSM